MTSPASVEQPADDDRPVLRLPPDLRRLRDARRFVSDAIAEWGTSPPERAAILTSEVVSNAMLHAGGDITIRVRRRDGHARVEVQDTSPEQPEAQPRDPYRIGGNGLHIVEGLATSWGVTQLPGVGKVVWFEVALQG